VDLFLFRPMLHSEYFSHFQTILPGDRFLVDDIGLEARLDAIGCLCGRSSVRRIYSPRVVGQEGDMTAAMKSGDDGAQEVCRLISCFSYTLPRQEWRGDIGSAHTEDVMPEDDIRFPRRASGRCLELARLSSLNRLCFRHRPCRLTICGGHGISRCY
jgi:hypothetical protein